ncbi:MAG: GNAT family N-acetyltransferase [Desulfobacterales bacterium]|nr:GNAT family N-acetyltransferase [Deltaproteobacteria bacterium]NNL41320.1 GNAT family N-acetyltransferase [Desulfobacterales bacterium]
MNIIFQFDLNGVNWSEAADLFRRAPLGVRDPDKLRRSCEQSFLVCFAYLKNKLVGMGRAISDGEYQAAIYDLVILPEYQNKGIGQQVMEELHRRLPVKTILLYAVPGKESFYRKLGYCKMLTAMAKRNEELDDFRLAGYIE